MSAGGRRSPRPVGGSGPAGPAGAHRGDRASHMHKTTRCRATGGGERVAGRVGTGPGVKRMPCGIPGAGIPPRRAHRHAAGALGPDERSDRSAAPGRCDRPRCRFRSGSAVTAEQRAPQPAQRREQRHPGAAAVPRTEMITCGELLHQGRRPFRLALRDGRTTQHREMAVETRTGRTAPAADGRDSRPATHCYLFHDSPHPTRAPGPGRVTLSLSEDTRADRSTDSPAPP